MDFLNLAKKSEETGLLFFLCPSVICVAAGQ